jgi:hypothetical protein
MREKKEDIKSMLPSILNPKPPDNRFIPQLGCVIAKYMYINSNPAMMRKGNKRLIMYD